MRDARKNFIKTPARLRWSRISSKAGVNKEFLFKQE